MNVLAELGLRKPQRASGHGFEGGIEAIYAELIDSRQTTLTKKQRERLVGAEIQVYIRPSDTGVVGIQKTFTIIEGNIVFLSLQKDRDKQATDPHKLVIAAARGDFNDGPGLIGGIYIPQMHPHTGIDKSYRRASGLPILAGVLPEEFNNAHDDYLSFRIYPSTDRTAFFLTTGDKHKTHEPSIVPAEEMLSALTRRQAANRLTKKIINITKEKFPIPS